MSDEDEIKKCYTHFISYLCIYLLNNQGKSPCHAVSDSLSMSSYALPLFVFVCYENL